MSSLVRLFVKDYKNTEKPAVRESHGKFASVVGILANVFLFLIKLVAGLLSNSISITADAINNLTDSGSSVVTLMGFKISGKPADAQHPYGHARMEYISGLIVSFIIMFLGLQLILSSVKKILNPEESVLNLLTIAILLVSILIKLWLSIFFRKIGKTINSSSLIATSVDSRNDIIATSAVLASTVIEHFSGYNLDGYIGTGVSIFILISGLQVAIETISPLLGVVPSKELTEKFYRKILSYDGVIGIHDLTIHNYGEGKCFASVHCEVPADQDIMISHDIIDNIEQDFLEKENVHLVIHLDPVVLNDERTNLLKQDVENIIADISTQISMHDFRVAWGVTHSNLIFDIIVPFDMQENQEEIITEIKKRIELLDPSYRTKITVDHPFIPDIGDI